MLLVLRFLDALTQKARIDNNNNNFVSKGMFKHNGKISYKIVAR